jgi:hypothetical protein
VFPAVTAWRDSEAWFEVVAFGPDRRRRTSWAPLRAAAEWRTVSNVVPVPHVAIVAFPEEDGVQR